MTGKLLRLLLFCLVPVCVGAAPDPATVEHWHQGWRYPQAGWIRLHIEGTPFERGQQHGHLLAREIGDYIHALARFWGPDAPNLAWENARRLTNALVMRSFSAEQLTEMEGIAQGATAEGVRFSGRELDLVDIVTLNVADELDTLDNALAATPTAIDRQTLTADQSGKQRLPRPRPMHPQRCSAFAANGKATRDGRIIFGHVTMYDLYPANYYNVWLDIRPDQGHRVAMQTTPGGIHSGMDYSINDAGILLSETTVNQTPLVSGGRALAARIRDAEQYGDSIESAAKYLSQDGNGLSATEWIMADIKRNEIALLTLGSHSSVLHRSSQNDWIAGTEGFYWSDNNIKDEAVRLETAGDLAGRPSPAASYAPSHRDEIWLKFYDQSKGQIDLDFARKILTTAEIDSPFAVDAKYTDADLAAGLMSWASFGPPIGVIWEPTATERHDFPNIKPLVPNPWTIMDLTAPPLPAAAPAVDRGQRPRTSDLDARKSIDPAAWHGTLRPSSDQDVWLSTAFANFERIVAREKRLRQRSGDHQLSAEDRQELGVELLQYRAQYELAVRESHDFPLAETRSAMRDSRWFKIASGKGVLFLQTLRGIIGADRFDQAMDQFGRSHAGQTVTTAEFQDFLQRSSEQDLQPIFHWWLNGTGLPNIVLQKVEAVPQSRGWITRAHFSLAPSDAPLSLPITVETSDGEVTRDSVIDAKNPVVEIVTPSRPKRLVADKYGLAAKQNGSPFTIFSFEEELAETVIVYGSEDEELANREAALMLQKALRHREFGDQPSVLRDRDVSDATIASHHLLLVGRPATNLLARRFAGQFGVSFGTHSFTLQDQLYIDPDSAVIAAGDNPLNPRFALVLIAGLGAQETYRLMPVFQEDLISYAQIVVMSGLTEDATATAVVADLARRPQTAEQ